MFVSQCPAPPDRAGWTLNIVAHGMILTFKMNIHAVLYSDIIVKLNVNIVCVVLCDILHRHKFSHTMTYVVTAKNCVKRYNI